MVIAPANTGNDNNNKIAVIRTLHTNRGNWWKEIILILKIVVIKLIAPKREETPAKCNENIPKSTAPPEWAWKLDKGGYTVHPV